MMLLQSVVNLWLSQIKQADEHKARKFGKTAKELWKFLGREYEGLRIRVDPRDTSNFNYVEAPYYTPHINKAAEYVALMMPFCFHHVPNRLVTASRPLPPENLAAMLGLDPMSPVRHMDEMRAWLMQWWLNWLCSDAGYGLHTEMRSMLPEAFVKGRGVLWHGFEESDYGMIPASRFGSVDGLGIDPDCEQLRDGAYIYRWHRESAWRVSERFGIERDKLRGVWKSHLAQATDNALNRERNDERDRDVVEWVEVWSRMGMGHKFSGEPADGSSPDWEVAKKAMEGVGPYVHLCLMPGLPHPLNLPPEAVNTESEAEIRARLAWPVPFWRDRTNPWPCTTLEFLPNPQDPWARSPLEVARGLIEFLDKAYGWMMYRLRTAGRSFTVTSDQMSQAIRDAMVNGYDLELPIAGGNVGEDLQKQFYHFEWPDMPRDAWQLVPMIERQIEILTGMDPLLGGQQTTKQIRTAHEAEIRREGLVSRPQDMADCVEGMMSQVAAKEGQMTRLYVDGQMVTPLFGEDYMAETPVGEVYGPLTQAWMQLVYTDDEARAFAELSYQVEAGSGQRKNQSKLAANSELFGRTFGPVVMGLNQVGVTEPYNGMVEWFGEAYDIPPKYIAKMLIPPGAIQPPAPEPANKGKSK